VEEQSMRVLRTAVLVVLHAVTAAASDVDGTPPSFVPDMVLSYVDPSSGETISCAPGCRRFEVPDGVVLEVRVRVLNQGGDIGGEGVAWDLWFDQRRNPFPGLDLAACHDESLGRVDIECWRAMNDRVEWEEWSSLVPDVTCVPEEPSGCGDVSLSVPMTSDHDGSRGRGVYSFAVWLDRFQVMSDADEFDNFSGPVRVKVVPPDLKTSHVDAAPAEPPSKVLVRAPSSPQPFTVLTFPARSDVGFTLSSQKSRGVLEFAPLYPGEVVVDVQQGGTFEKMVVEIRKVSTGEVLGRGSGKGRLRFEGRVGLLDLKDDRRLQVVVIPDHGTRGVRGTINVSYPARASYRRTE
jgi:hypothetical protein